MASHRCIFVFYGRNGICFFPDSHWSRHRSVFEEVEYTFNLKLINFSAITTYCNSLDLSVSLVLPPQASQRSTKTPQNQNNFSQWGLHSIIGLSSVIGMLLTQGLQKSIVYSN